MVFCKPTLDSYCRIVSARSTTWHTYKGSGSYLSAKRSLSQSSLPCFSPAYIVTVSNVTELKGAESRNPWGMSIGVVAVIPQPMSFNSLPDLKTFWFVVQYLIHSSKIVSLLLSHLHEKDSCYLSLTKYNRPHFNSFLSIHILHLLTSLLRYWTVDIGRRSTIRSNMSLFPLHINSSAAWWCLIAPEKTPSFLMNSSNSHSQKPTLPWACAVFGEGEITASGSFKHKIINVDISRVTF